MNEQLRRSCFFYFSFYQYRNKCLKSVCYSLPQSVIIQLDSSNCIARMFIESINSCLITGPDRGVLTVWGQITCHHDSIDPWSGRMEDEIVKTRTQIRVRGV